MYNFLLEIRFLVTVFVENNTTTLFKMVVNRGRGLRQAVQWDTYGQFKKLFLFK